MAHLIEPGFSVETAGFDYQRVTIPLRYRVAEPLRIRIFGQFTPIHKKLAELVEGFVEHHDDVGLLKDLEGERRGVNLRNALRQAVGVGVLCGERVILALVVDRLGLRGHADFAGLQTGTGVSEFGRIGDPDSCEVGFAVGSTGYER